MVCKICASRTGVVNRATYTQNRGVTKLRSRILRVASPPQSPCGLVPSRGEAAFLKESATDRSGKNNVSWRICDAPVKSSLHSFAEIQFGEDIFYTVQVEVKTRAQEKIWIDLKLPSRSTMTKRMETLGYGRNSLCNLPLFCKGNSTNNPTFPYVL